jgi:hypothetical protein
VNESVVQEAGNSYTVLRGDGEMFFAGLSKHLILATIVPLPFGADGEPRDGLPGAYNFRLETRF